MNWVNQLLSFPGLIMASNGTATKSPPSTSPLHNSKFFQSNMRILITGELGLLVLMVDKLMENKKNEVCY
ncbi:UDP-glucuronate decarboxylase [Ranunculus cassubicifolius]